MARPSNFLRPPHSRCPRCAAAAAAAEALEARRLLATLVVNGGDGDDHMVLEVDNTFIFASVNGVVVPQPVGLWDDIQINGLGGNDEIFIENTRDEPVDVFPGTGADTIGVCDRIDLGTGAGADLDALVSRVVVHAGTDATDDNLTISDAADVGNDSYNIDETPGPMRLTKPGFTPDVQWGESNLNVEIDINAGHNQVNIASNVSLGGTDETLTITGLIPLSGMINQSPGDDTVTFNGTISADNELKYIDRSGSDALLLIGDTFAGNATIAADSIELITVSDAGPTDTYLVDVLQVQLIDGAQIGTIDYTSVSAIGISSTSSTQSSTFEVESLLSGDDLSISAGGGDDTFDVNVVLAGNSGNLSMSGGGGTDTMALDSTGIGPGGNSTHTFDNATYDRDGLFGSLAYSSINALTFVGNPGADHFTVGTGLDLTTLTLNGNDNNDTFTVTPTSGTGIFCNGGLPTTGLNERLTLMGGGASGGILTPNGAAGGTYTFANRDPVTFTGIEVFTLPAAAPSEVDLAAADDTGISNTDNITSDTSLNFSGTGAPASVPVRLFRDGAQVASATATAGGAYAFANVSFPTGDDTFAMVARYETTATGLLSLPGPALNVRVDAVAPAPPGLADMDAASDTGISATDNVTADDTPTFVGTVTTNEIIRLFANGVAVGSDTSTAGGTYSITTSALADGSQIITARQEDLAGNLSTAGPGLVAIIDTVAPPAPTAAPDLVAASDTGVSSTDNVTRDNTPTFTGTAPGNHIVRLIDRFTEVGFVQLPLAVTTYNITSSTLADGNRLMATRFEDIAGNQSPIGPSLTVRIDTVAPTLTDSAFNFLTSQNLKFTFNEDVGGGIRVDNFTLRDVTNGVNAPNSSLAMSYAPNTATVTFPGFAGGILTDADWQMKVASDVTDVAGNHFGGTSFDFYFLNGDANRDRRVNLNDFNIMVSNFGQSPRTFEQGDFTYDGVVNLNDFNVLASRFGTVLGPGAAPAPAARARLIDELT